MAMTCKIGYSITLNGHDQCQLCLYHALRLHVSCAATISTFDIDDSFTSLSEPSYRDIKKQACLAPCLIAWELHLDIYQNP
jgi:hypothetical protein